MNKITKLIKSKFVLSIVVILTLIMTQISLVAYADNIDGSVKAVNVLGYEYVNRTTIKVFFDKGLSNLNQGQFKIETAAGTPITISNMSTASGTGWTNAQSPTGTTVTLTTAQLDYDTRYTVKVSSTIEMGNSYALTLGNYWLHNDIEFHFKTPNSNGVYSGTPVFDYIPESTFTSYVGKSANVEVISDMPIDASSLTLSNVKLQKKVGGTYQDVTVDTTLDSNPQSGAECYATQINDAHTCIFIPETLRGGTPAYNLTDSSEYLLVLPNNTIKGANGSYFAGDDQAFTTGLDTAACTNTAPSVTGYSSSSVSLSWSDVTDSTTGSIPNHYHIYYSTNPYFGFVKSTASVNHNGTTNTCAVTGLSGTTTYYFRIVPANSADQEGGFSPYASQATI